MNISPELLHQLSPETLQILVTIGSLTFLSFSVGTKNKILDRDGHRSVESGEPKKGIRLCASHKDHTRNWMYDSIENGETLTYPEHFMKHLEWFMQGMEDGLWRSGLSPDYHLWACEGIFGDMNTDEVKLLQSQLRASGYSMPTITHEQAKEILKLKFPKKYPQKTTSLFQQMKLRLLPR